MANKKKNKVELKKPAGNFSGRKLITLTLLLIVVVASIFYLQDFSSSSLSTSSENSTTETSTVIPFTKEGELTFRSAEGKYKLMIDIEIAETPAERERGMMYRNQMSDTQGMFFIFDGNEPRSFWMKNTHLPLDIMFVDEGGEIVTIHKNTVPYDESSLESTAPAKFVVEVVAGFSDKNGIVSGDKIVWRRIQ